MKKRLKKALKWLSDGPDMGAHITAEARKAAAKADAAEKRLLEHPNPDREATISTTFDNEHHVPGPGISSLPPEWQGKVQAVESLFSDQIKSYEALRRTLFPEGFHTKKSPEMETGTDFRDTYAVKPPLQESHPQQKDLLDMRRALWSALEGVFEQVFKAELNNAANAALGRPEVQASLNIRPLERSIGKAFHSLRKTIWTEATHPRVDYESAPKELPHIYSIIQELVGERPKEKPAPSTRISAAQRQVKTPKTGRTQG